MGLGEHVVAVFLAAVVGVRPGQAPAAPPQPEVDARLLADLELIRMLDMLRDLDAIRRMDEMMGPARAERKAPPEKTR